MYKILTLVNFVGSIVAIWYAIRFLYLYKYPPRFKTFILMNVIALVFLLLTQVYVYFNIAGEWFFKLGAFYWWGNFIHFIWSIRFISIRKIDKNEKHLRRS